jgi:hypothetical protein
MFGSRTTRRTVRCGTFASAQGTSSRDHDVARTVGRAQGEPSCRAHSRGVGPPGPPGLGPKLAGMNLLLGKTPQTRFQVGGHKVRERCGASLGQYWFKGRGPAYPPTHFDFVFHAMIGTVLPRQFCGVVEEMQKTAPTRPRCVSNDHETLRNLASRCGQ